MPTNPAGHRLEGFTYLDDGAVIYLNGTEAGRVRMPSGNVTARTAANSSVDNFSREALSLPGTSLVQGTNVLAVEVHQSSATSADVAWGLELNAVRSTTNTVVFGLVLNEVLARNASFTNAGGTNLADWVELYNPSTSSFDLAGLSLTDTLDQPRRWVFPAGATLAGGSYLVVRFDDQAPPTALAGGVLNTGFALNGEAGDAVHLFDSPTRGSALLDSISFGIQVTDYSLGRVPAVAGTGPWKLGLPTPGAANITASLA